ncbi:hypothetical protein [Rhodanobacter hydrolyticus]|uniref:HNH endonuclease n=1 Tax=Rhodanobacter hydrolyticus TaxID=2250595 RepID=A0ABW8J3K6_9GAMM
MATTIVPLRSIYPRWHRFCDHCSNEFEGQQLFFNHRENAAGGFTWALCRDCISALNSKRKSVRENAYKRAMVRHAARYSEEFCQFVAQWYGVRRVHAHKEAKGAHA